MIELFHVCKRYLGTDTPALDDVNLTIAKGEFVVLAGPSGAGKSTLLRMLFCAEFATSGQVMLGGRNLQRLKRSDVARVRRGVGVVFQDFKLLPDVSVMDNVALAMEVQGWPQAAIKSRVTAILQQLGLGHKAQQHAAHLSGGEQQRVAMARALVLEPAVLLCDEPTGNLDTDVAKDVLELLITAHIRGATVIVATHDPNLIESGKRRVVRLQAGRVTSDVPAFSPSAPRPRQAV